MSSLNDFFIHSMVHPDVAAAYLEGKPVPQALLINEVPETSVVPVVSEIVSSKSGKILLFKMTIGSGSHESKLSGLKLDKPDSPLPDTPEYLIIGEILSSYSGWSMIGVIDSMPYITRESREVNFPSPEDSDDSEDQLLPPLNQLLFINSGDLKSTSEGIPVYTYNYIKEDDNDTGKTKGMSEIVISISEFWNNFNSEHLEKIGDIRILNAPTFTNLGAKYSDENIVINADIYDPDLLYQMLGPIYAFISMPDPENPDNIIKGMIRLFEAVLGDETWEDYFRTHIFKGTYSVYPGDIYWNFEDESDDVIHEYHIADGTNMSLKLGFMIQSFRMGDVLLSESSEVEYIFEIPRFGAYISQYENNLNMYAYVAPHKFGIENVENIPDDIELTLQYQEKGAEGWIDIENTGEWEYYPANPEFPGSWDEWEYYITIDISSILASMGDNESKLYNLRGAITINGQTEESESEFVITTKVQEKAN